VSVTKEGQNSYFKAEAVLRPAYPHPCAMVRLATLILGLQLTNRSSATGGGGGEGERHSA